MQAPTATYRLQFNPSFDFQKAKSVISYLCELGISDIYASPIFKAVKGSTHGYDVVDPNELNPELGNWEDFAKLMDERQKCKMGWLQDIVPNHMAFNSENKMLMDLFESGKQSPFFNFFDIRWDHPDKELGGKVLVPVLGRLYKKALASGKIQLGLNIDGFYVQYYEFCLPLCLSSYSNILSYGFKKFKFINPPLKSSFKNLDELCDQFDQLAEQPFSESRDKRVRKIKKTLWELYSSKKTFRTYIDRILDLYNGKNSMTDKFTPLEALLSRQYFRLALWRKASERINYRRFFYLNEFICLRVENTEVFEFTHRLLLRLAQEGKFTGLRIDHIDGLYNPTDYLSQLRKKLGGTYIVAEKILEDRENLPNRWPIQGTTGYEFANYVNKLFCCKENEKAFSKIYTHFIGKNRNYDNLVYKKKKYIIRKFMSGDVKYLTHLFGKCLEARNIASYATSQNIEDAIIEIIAAFPVYRTYITKDKCTKTDKGYIRKAISLAVTNNPRLKHAINAIGKCLLCEGQRFQGQRNKKSILNFIMKFQQLTGPAMAKGFEDTVLYCYNRLLSLNEVGSQPDCFGISVEEFHKFNSEKAKRWPHSLNATSTHDTKRGEDVRARINVLSEMPEKWDSKVNHWRRINERKKSKCNGRMAPDAKDEYFLYQTLIGALPFNKTEYEAFRKRIKKYFIKAVKEAKVHTSWVEPNEKYESACVQFVDKLLSFSERDEFWRDFTGFQRKVAGYAIYNSLSQILIKAAAPGVPDFYQGSELWDLNLVDPDNRRPVNFNLRAKLLAQIKNEEDQNELNFVTELLKHPEDGRVKLFLIYKLLSARTKNRQIFDDGDYIPLTTAGSKSEYIIAFARKSGTKIAIAVAARFLSSVINPKQLPIGKNVWKDTSIIISDETAGYWLNIITGEKINISNKLSIGHILNKFPVALLVTR
jgi:(1->4)-alpha-D-glucan 1-alpha-D-glucosylmutase